MQETRRLIEAIWQNIVYEEGLHLILGDEIFTKFNLGADYNIDGPGLNPVMTDDEVSTAAFRFGHTLIPDFVPFEDMDFTVRQDGQLPDVSK